MRIPRSPELTICTTIVGCELTPLAFIHSALPPVGPPRDRPPHRPTVLAKSGASSSTLRDLYSWQKDLNPRRVTNLIMACGSMSLRFVIASCTFRIDFFSASCAPLHCITLSRLSLKNYILFRTEMNTPITQHLENELKESLAELRNAAGPCDQRVKTVKLSYDRVS